MNKQSELEKDFPYFLCDDRVDVGKEPLPHDTDELKKLSSEIDQYIQEFLKKT